MKNCNYFSSEEDNDTMEKPEDLKIKKSKSVVRHSKTVTIERRFSESRIKSFVIDNKFTVLGSPADWILTWENFSDVFYQTSRNEKLQHLNLNAVKISAFGVGKVLVRKQKFTEDNYTEFELIATRRLVGSSRGVMEKQSTGLRLKKLEETRSVSVLDGVLEIENDISLEIWGSQDNIFIQVKLVIIV